jgi:glycosyltransferase involved in cell wall biosynthesis
MKTISVVIPVYNEAENISDVYLEVAQVLGEMKKSTQIAEFEIIFVDDGSKDDSLLRLREIALKDAQVRVVELRRNFGQTAAMAAGLDSSRFDIVVTMDGDCQNDPGEIPAMLKKLEQGYDLVAGWRKERKDPFLSRKLPSRIANWLISKSTNVYLHDYGCTLKVMTGEIARGIKLYGEMHRFIPALAAEMGARVAEIPVNHRLRTRGESKYGISRTFRVVLDLVTVKFLLGYSKRPIHLFGALGFATGSIGLITLAVMTYQRLFLGQAMGSRPLLALAVMMIIIGLQFLVFGLLAEVLARTYYESQDKRIYSIRKIWKSDDEKPQVAAVSIEAGETPVDQKRAWETKLAV